MELSQARSALIVKPSSLGDVVHALPVLPLLRAAFPEMTLRWLVNPEWAPLLEGHPHLDAVVDFPRGRFRGVRGLVRFARWGRQVRDAECEVPEFALDFQGLFRSGFIPRIRGCAEVVGFRDAREGASTLYTKAVAPPEGIVHAVDRNLALLDRCGIAIPETPEFILPKGSAPDKALPSRFVLLHPFARGTGKALQPKQITRLIELLAPAKVVLVGRSDEPVDLNGEADRVVDLVNRTTLPELAWVCRRAAAIISMDSGPMHIAAAVAGNRVLGIHTWTDTRKVGPYHPQAVVWKAGRIAGRDDFSEEELASGKLPKDHDLENIAAWARSKLDEYLD